MVCCWVLFWCDRRSGCNHACIWLRRTARRRSRTTTQSRMRNPSTGTQAGYSDGTVIPGGWIDHHYIQLAYQLMDSASGFAWSFVVTTAILWIMHFIPGLRLRSSEEAEIVGIDDAEMGEYAYDYVALDSELGLNQHPHGPHEIPNELDGHKPMERRGGHAGPEDVVKQPHLHQPSADASVAEKEVSSSSRTST